MKHFACIIMLLLACLPPIVAQELSDSAFLDAEMEDSISGMAIMPVKKPKKLLDSIITRLLYDMERKPIARKYKVENTFVVGSTPSFKVKYILSAETGIEMKIVTGEDFSFEGLSGKSYDASSIKKAIPIYTGFFPSHIRFISDTKKIPKPKALKNLIHKYYDVTVYRISDESGRGTYRITYSPKKKRITHGNYNYCFDLITATAYFDMNTLQLVQEKGRKLHDIQPIQRMFEKQAYAGDASFSYSTPTSETWTRVLYQVDYETNANAPIIKKIRFERNINGDITKGTVLKL